MTTKQLSKNGTRPLFDLGTVWRWVEYPAFDVVGDNFPYQEGFAGFAVEVLVNPNGEQDRAKTMALRAYIARLQELNKSDPDNQQLVDEAEDRYFLALLPFLRAWNVAIDHEELAVPRDSDDPAAQFRLIPEPMRHWALAVIREITVPKRRTPPSVSVGSGATSMPTTTPPDPERPAS